MRTLFSGSGSLTQQLVSSPTHQSTTGPSQPQPAHPSKNFDCHAMLAGSKIINYCMSADEKWCVLIGILPNTVNPQAFKVMGSMQLFSHDCGVSQLIYGHAAVRSYGNVSRD